MSSTVIDIDKAFKVIIIDANIHIDKYFGNYYVLIDDQYLAFRPVADGDYIQYMILDNAPAPPNSKIDYSKLGTMQGITSIMFSQDGINATNPNLDIDEPLTMPTPLMVSIPALEYEPALEPVLEPEPALDEPAPEPAPELALEPAPEYDPLTVAEPDEADDGEVLDVDESDFGDIFDMFAAGEVTVDKMVRISGVELQRVDVNLSLIKSLLEKTDNEFLNEVQSQFLINMQKIAEQRSKNTTVGQLMLNVKGLPNWIVPVVKGSWTTVEHAYAEVKQDSFQVETTSSSCNITLDLVNEPLYTGYSMDTDKMDGLPGSWRKSRTDFTVNAVYEATDKKGSSFMRLIKLPGNSYETKINLTETAINRIINNRNKNASMYARMITLPKSISSIDVELIGTGRTASVSGLLVRAPGMSAKPLSSTHDKFVELKCTSSKSHQSTLEKVLTEVYPSVDQVIGGWEDKDNVFTEDFFKLLKQYKYDRADLTKANWSRIGDIIKRNLKSLVDEDWATKHTETVKKFKRTRDLEPKEMQAADNGKFMLKTLLDEYLRINDTDIKLPEAMPGTPVQLTGNRNNARYNSIMMDPVHGLVFLSDVTGKFYVADEYRKQLRYQLIQRLQVNLDMAEHEKLSMTSETLGLILTDLEYYRWTANKGILDSLRIKLATSNTVASSTLNMLNQFDLSDIAGQVSYIRHMTTFIQQGFIRLDPISKKYYIVQSQERVCCEHEFEDIKQQPLTDFIGQEGKCKYCGAQLVHLDQSDDYGQTQFMTARDMYTAQGEDIPDTDPDFATLDYFIEHAIKYLEPYLADRGIVMSTANHKQIKEDTIAYIKDQNASAAKPYGSIISSPPKGGLTSDLRLAILYGLPITLQKDGESKSDRTAFKTNEKGNSVTTVAFSRILAYFREVEPDSTTDSVPIIYKKLKAVLVDQLKTNESFTMLHNMLVLNRLCYCYGVMVAQMNLTVNNDYSNSDSLEYLMDESTIYNVCNTFNTRMNVVLSQHIQNLATGSKEGQLTIMPYFEAYRRMFAADFSKDLYNIGLTSQSVDGVIKADDRALVSFNNRFDDLKRKNVAMYDRIASNIVGFAEYEAAHGMVPKITASAPRAPSDINNMEDYMACWAVKMERGSVYGDRLWKQYAAINRDLGEVRYDSGTVSEYLTKVTKVGRADDKSLESITFQASVCSSKELLNGPILQEEPDEAMHAYLTNEQNLSDFKASHEDKFLLDKEFEEFCQFNLAVPSFNKSLQTNQMYYPCNLTPKGDIKAEIIGQKPDIDETMRKEYKSPVLLDNMRALAKYKTVEGYATALDRVIFNKRESGGVARLNFLTNDIEVNVGSAKTITHSDAHALVVNRQFTLGLADSLEEPDEVDEIPGFNDDFPTLIKSDVQLQKDNKDTINRRRIFRIQNNGRALKSLLGWMSTELSAESYEMLKALSEESELNVSGSRYAIEKELASMTGYKLIDLLNLKWQMRDKIANMNLSNYSQAIPEIYTMSYVEYAKIMDMLSLPDEKNLSSFRDMVFGAIRLDIILHVKRMGSSLGVNFNLTDELFQNIHNFDLTPAGGSFITMVTKMLDAMARINIDPNVDSLNKLYEARQMERMTISIESRYKAKTGFDMAVIKTAEKLTSDNDPDLENPEGEADSDDDGQPDNSDVEGDDGESEFDDEELAGMVEGDIEVPES
jgi:hypothetical protein